MKQPKDQSTREKILKMLQNHAEEPEEIEDGTGTFTTFRTEYLINDISDLLASSQRELLENLQRFLSNQGARLEPFDLESMVRRYKVSSPDIEAIWYQAQKRLTISMVKGLEDIKSQLAHATIPVTPKSTIDLLKKGKLRSQLSGEEKSK